MNIAEINPSASNLATSGLNKTNPLVQKHLSSPEFKSIISSLGIKPDNIHSITKKPLTDQNLALKDLQFVKITKDHSNIIKELGIQNAELAIVLSAQDEINTIKKKFKKIKDSLLDNESTQKLLQLLGIKYCPDSMVFNYTSGGLLIIKKGFQQIHADEEN
jgi:DNA-directed RNA polymerase subunit N (RpoN/RPB10)/DNA-directed RNA polymerase subunit H (RpoH/RPB5)